MANILELTERAVDLEGLGELLHSSRVSVELVIVIEVATNGVALEAATESRIDASKAADGCQIGQVWTGALDGLQRGIHFEHLADRDDALGSVGATASPVDPAERVAVQPERQGLSKTQAPSAGIDSKERYVEGVLDAGKRLVHFERLGDVLSELGTDIVVCDAVQAREHTTR